MLLDWSRGLKVSTFRSKHRSAVVDIVEAKDLDKEFDSETSVFHMFAADAAKMKVK